MSEPGTVSGDEVDHLLELCWKLRQREDAEGALKLFCDIRLRMEQRHYLAFFRMRRWLENHLVASVSICPDAEPQFVPVARPLLRRSYPTRLSVRGAAPGIRAPRAAFAFHVSRDRSHEGNYGPWCHLARRSWLSCKPYRRAVRILVYVRQHRGDHNRLGFGVQMCSLRFPGRALGEDERPPDRLLNLVATQLGISIVAWDLYARRDETRREHLLELLSRFRGNRSNGTFA